MSEMFLQKSGTPKNCSNPGKNKFVWLKLSKQALARKQEKYIVEIYQDTFKINSINRRNCYTHNVQKNMKKY